MSTTLGASDKSPAAAAAPLCRAVVLQGCDRPGGSLAGLPPSTPSSPPGPTPTLLLPRPPAPPPPRPSPPPPSPPPPLPECTAGE